MSVSQGFTLRLAVISPFAVGSPGATLVNIDQAITVVFDQVLFSKGAPSIRGAQSAATSTVLMVRNSQFIGHVGPAVTGCGEAWTFDTVAFEADSTGKANAFSNSGVQACKGLVFINPWMGDATANGGTWIKFNGSGLHIQGGRITGNSTTSNEAVSFSNMLPAFRSTAPHSSFFPPSSILTATR